MRPNIFTFRRAAASLTSPLCATHLIRFPFSQQHRASTSDQEPLSRRLRLLVPQLLQAGGAAGDLGRSSGGLRAGGRQPGQRGHELRPGLFGRSGPERDGRLDRTQTEGGVFDPA